MGIEERIAELELKFSLLVTKQAMDSMRTSKMGWDVDLLQLQEAIDKITQPVSKRRGMSTIFPVRQMRRF